MTKIDELQNLLATNISKVSDLVNKEEAKEKKCPIKAKTVFAIIGIIVVAAAAIYGLYRFFAPDYLEDFEDDLDDSFEEDFFDDADDDKEEEPFVEEYQSISEK